MHQLHVKYAFLNGPLEEEIYFKQPPGFNIKGNERIFVWFKAIPPESGIIELTVFSQAHDSLSADMNVAHSMKKSHQ